MFVVLEWLTIRSFQLLQVLVQHCFQILPNFQLFNIKFHVTIGFFTTEIFQLTTQLGGKIFMVKMKDPKLKRKICNQCSRTRTVKSWKLWVPAKFFSHWWEGFEIFLKLYFTFFKVWFPNFFWIRLFCLFSAQTNNCSPLKDNTIQIKRHNGGSILWCTFSRAHNDEVVLCKSCL